METFVKRFIIISIIYLGIASLLGVLMLYNPTHLSFKFAHSHLMMLGWVSMMIYGVGYHILPRFSGRQLKSNKIGEVQFWLANVGLVGMAVTYTIFMQGILTTVFGLIEVVSVVLFVYNMLATLLAKTPEE